MSALEKKIETLKQMNKNIFKNELNNSNEKFLFNRNLNYLNDKSQVIFFFYKIYSNFHINHIINIQFKFFNH